MGFLHKLWDETLAGPAPDSGLGKLRKYNSLSASTSTSTSTSVQLPGDDPLVPVTRAITVVRHNSARIPNLTVSVDSSSSMPSSPAAASTPATPRTPTTPDGSIKKLMRGKSTPAALPQGESRTPTGYDWIVLSALDR